MGTTCFLAIPGLWSDAPISPPTKTHKKGARHHPGHFSGKDTDNNIAFGSVKSPSFSSTTTSTHG
eukprot:3583364-Prorocentrum_lima.AAC.1